jgi:hypothetical protein
MFKVLFKKRVEEPSNWASQGIVFSKRDFISNSQAALKHGAVYNFLEQVPTTTK